ARLCPLPRIPRDLFAIVLRRPVSGTAAARKSASSIQSACSEGFSGVSGTPCRACNSPRVATGSFCTALLVGLGIGRAQVARRNAIRTVLETVSIGIAAALAGVAIGVLINHLCSH